MAKSSKSVNSTIITLGVVAIVAYIAYKYFSKHRFGGGGSGGGGPVGGVAGSAPYYPNYQQPQSGSGAGLQIGGNPNRQNTNDPFAGLGGFVPGGSSIAQALASGYYDASSENALATIYNAQQQFSTANDAPIDFGNPTEWNSDYPTSLSEQPTDTSSIFGAFNDWWNSWTGNDVNPNTGPSGSDISEQELSDYSTAQDESLTGLSIDDSGDSGGGYDISEYGGGDAGGDFSYADNGDYGGGGYGGEGVDETSDGY